MRVLLAGFGRVGRTVAELLAERPRRPGLSALDVSVVAITTGSHGALANPDGLNLAGALAEIRARGGFTAAHPDFATLDTLAALRTLDLEVLVELSPLSVARRGEPAISHVREALRRRRHVVTANKGPLAWAYASLTKLAREQGCALLHEATVMDGAPVFNLVRRCLRGNVILAIDGVLNSTTNVVLGELERGASLPEALDAARRAGVVEADPSDDLDGWDAAAKIAVLANALMGGDLTPERVERESVRAVSPERMARASARGCRLKMVCEVFREGGTVGGRVAARELPAGDPFAAIDGTSSVIRLATDIVGTLVIAENSPDLRTTAYGVLSDLLEVAEGVRR